MLITCPECELQVSDKAYTCPHCGYPLKTAQKEYKPSTKRLKSEIEKNKITCFPCECRNIRVEVV